MLRKAIITAVLAALASPAAAGDWSTVHHYVHCTGNCDGMREVLASHYGSGSRVSTGARFDPNGNTAASWDYALGTTITVRNPHNGRTASVLINDRGPSGTDPCAGTSVGIAAGS